MMLSKTQTYFLFIGLLLAVLSIYQSIWLLSDITPGHIQSFGTGRGKRGKHIQFVTVRYQVNDVAYIETYLRNEYPTDEKSIEIRYLSVLPSISRTNTFPGNWGLVIAILATLFPIITICFLAKDVIPPDSRFLFRNKFPF